MNLQCYRSSKCIAAFAALLCSFMINACSSSKKDKNIETNPQGLYEEGVKAIYAKKFGEAAKKFVMIEKEHPASKFAVNATMLKGYVYFKNDKFDDAIFATEDFIKQYPGNPNIDYVYYLKALAYYEQIMDLERDQSITEQTLGALTEITARFPGSKYALDAKKKKYFVYNTLAGKEMAIGRFYLYQDKLSAAVNRFQNVIQLYSTTIFIPEALYRMVEVYTALGVQSQAQNYAAVLGHNYPTSIWYHKAYNLVK